VDNESHRDIVSAFHFGYRVQANSIPELTEARKELLDKAANRDRSRKRLLLGTSQDGQPVQKILQRTLPGYLGVLVTPEAALPQLDAHGASFAAYFPAPGVTLPGSGNRDVVGSACHMMRRHGSSPPNCSPAGIAADSRPRTR
jgi:hypothetical protein